MTPILSSTILRTQSDARLVALARDGHERAFEAIVERYRRPLLRFCRRFLPEPRAEDAVQQAFLGAWSSLRTGTEVGDLRTWLYRIARNAALDAVKRSGYDYAELTDALSLAPAPDGEVERRWVVRETLTGVAALPENQREALLRTAVQGQSRAQIARELQLSEGAVRQLVHRARASLRAAATALTPGPLVTWAAELGTAEAPMVSRIGELVAGAGAGAVGGASLLKTGTAVVTAGALAVGVGSEVNEPSRSTDAIAAPSSPGEEDRRRSGSRIAKGTRDANGSGRGGGGAGVRTQARRGDNSGPGSVDSGPATANSGPGSVNSGPGSVNTGSGSADADSSGSGDSDFSGSSSSRSGSSGSGSDDDDHSGPGSGDDDDHDEDHSGPGDDDDDDDSSGSGSGDDEDSDSEDDEDNSGSGSGDDDDSGSDDDDDD